MRSRYCVKPHSYQPIETDHQPEKLQWTKPAAGNDDKHHEYSMRRYQKEKLNTVTTCLLSAIISRRTYNQWRDLIPELAIPRTEGMRPLRVSSVATTSLQIEQSALTSIVVDTNNSRKLEEARRTAKTSKAIGTTPTIPIPGI